MPNWNEILNEMINLGKRGDQAAPDTVRRKYLKQLQEKTGRNVIAYYSGWLQKPGMQETMINDDDKNGFMMAIHNMDTSKGLDLILHTPGGQIVATESIVDYVHRKFLGKSSGIDFRVVVPQLAMSAGTMIACASQQIVMGKQSSLGPIDPQLQGVPAHGVVAEFERAHSEISKDPSKLAVWQFILQKYHPTFLSECENAIALSEEMVEKTLKTVMFKGQKDAAKKAKAVVSYLTAYTDRKTHSRHINIDQCKDIGLKISDLEDDQEFQDLVLTVHHCFMHTLANTPAIKIIENHYGATMARLQAFVQVQ